MMQRAAGRPLTTLLLIRRASCDTIGRILSGRAADVHLNANGNEQADRLARRLEDVPPVAVYSSPLERARETADALACRRELPVRILDALNEIDFGAWTGSVAAIPY